MGPREIKQKRERDMSPERNEFILEEKKTKQSALFYSTFDFNLETKKKL